MVVNATSMVIVNLDGVSSSFSFNNIPGDFPTYGSDQFSIVVNFWGNPSSHTSTVLPNLTQKFLRGTSAMGGVATSGGNSTHTHSVSSLYAQIEREGSAIVLKETGTISSWTPTDRVVGSTGAGNTTPSRTVGTAIGGNLPTADHTPPYVGVNYIIKT